MYINSRINYYIEPEEIADALIEHTDAEYKQQRDNLVYALEWLETAAENPHNRDGFRVLMDILQDFADRFIPLF